LILLILLNMLTFAEVGNYSLFVKHWADPHGGIHGYLHRFLESGDSTFQHIAIWTLLQLLQSDDNRLIDLIQKAADISRMVTEIADRNVAESSDGDGDESRDEEGEGEVVALARQCAELIGPKKLREG
jgi:vacuolar protein 8